MTEEAGGIPTLETRRLVLRAFDLGDAAEVRRLAGDFEIARMTLAVPHPYEAGMAEAWIGTHAADFAAGRDATWAVTRREDGRLVGAITLTIQQKDGRAMIGYWIGREYWGNGYATEAGREVVRFGFERLGLRRIYATHLGSNPASGRVMQKIGMTYEGRQVGHYLRWGNVEDCVIYGITAGGRGPAVIGVHHVQITVPKGAEGAAREFYCGVLGLAEVEKPESLKGRGGLWLRVGNREVHVGTEDGVDRRATKGHVAYEVTRVEAWREKLAGVEILESVPIPGYERFEFRDPFGNRVEMIAVKPDGT